MSLADCCLNSLQFEAVGYGLYWPPKISLANLLSGNMSLADCCLTCLYTEAVGYGLHWPLIISLANLLSGNMSLADCCLTCPFQVPCSLASTSLGLADGLFRLLLPYSFWLLVHSDCSTVHTNLVYLSHGFMIPHLRFLRWSFPLVFLKLKKTQAKIKESLI